MSTECRVCNARADSFAHATILGTRQIEYFRCSRCHFIQTETPTWLDQAYSEAIISTDVGLVWRNERFASIVDRALRFVFPAATSCVDYGGGYGMFTRMLRDRGHDFRHYDPYCENLFAKGFETLPGSQRFDFLTAFEVLEHLADPHSDLRRIDGMADNWLVSTLLVPDPPPQPSEWWYYALEGGQHVALWTQRALEDVAARYDRRLITTRRGIHLFSRERINSRWARHILRGRTALVLNRFRTRKSLLEVDYREALAAKKPLAA